MCVGKGSLPYYTRRSKTFKYKNTNTFFRTVFCGNLHEELGLRAFMLFIWTYDLCQSCSCGNIWSIVCYFRIGASIQFGIISRNFVNLKTRTY